MYVFVCVCVCMYVRVNVCGGSYTGDAATNTLYSDRQTDRQPLRTSQMFSSKCTKPVPSQTVHNPWFYEIWNTSTLLKIEFAIGRYLEPDKSIQQKNYFLILRWRALSANIYIYYIYIWVYWFHTSDAQRMTAALRSTGIPHSKWW